MTWLPYLVIPMGVSILTTLLLLHVMIIQINKIDGAPRVEHRGRYTFGEVNAIRQIHEEFLPASQVRQVFTFLSYLDVVAGGVILVLFITAAVMTRPEFQTDSR